MLEPALLECHLSALEVEWSRQQAKNETYSTSLLRLNIAIFDVQTLTTRRGSSNNDNNNNNDTSTTSSCNRFVSNIILNPFLILLFFHIYIVLKRHEYLPFQSCSILAKLNAER